MDQDLGRSPLASAANSGDLELVLQLLQNKDIEIDKRDFAGYTPLALAVEKGHSDVVMHLLAHGANPNYRNMKLAPPLWKAARYGHTQVVRHMLDTKRLSDMNIEFNGYYGSKKGTAFSASLNNGHWETALLLASKENINPHVERSPIESNDAIVQVLAFMIRDGARDDLTLPLLKECYCYLAVDFKVTEKLLVLGAEGQSYAAVHELLKGHREHIKDSTCYTTSLIKAVKNEDEKMARLLLSIEDIDPNFCSYHETPLIVASKEGNKKMAELLLSDRRVEIDRRDPDGHTALSHAAENWHEGIIVLLMDAGANAAYECEDHGSLLVRALTRINFYSSDEDRMLCESTVRCLLSYDRIDINRRTKYKMTLLSHVVEYGFLDLAISLLEYPHIDVECGFENSPLAFAIQHDRIDIVRLLLKSGRIDINAERSTYGEKGTALVLAARNLGPSRRETVQALLSTVGIDIEKRSESSVIIGTGRRRMRRLVYMTPLMHAVECNNIEVADELLKAGANVNSQDDLGRTVLHLTVANSTGSRKGQPMMEMLELLSIQKTIDPNLFDNEDHTALSVAAKYGLAAKLDLLLGIPGIDPNKASKNGKTPLMWAFCYDFPQSREGDYQKVAHSLLSIQDVDPNIVDSSGETPLLLAIEKPRSDLFVKLFLERKDLQINLLDRNGHTPLDRAKEKGNPATLSLLRSHGALDSEPSTLPTDAEVTSGIVDNPTETEGNLDEFLKSRSFSNIDNESQGIGPWHLSRPVQVSSSLKGVIRSELSQEYTLTLRSQDDYIHALTAETSSTLCSRCAAIDLESAFSTRHTRLGGRHIAKLGTMKAEDDEKSHSCPLCHLMFAVRPNSHPDDEFELISLSTTQSWICQNSIENWCNFRDPWVDTMAIAVVPSSLVKEQETDSRFRLARSSSAEDIKVSNTAVSTGLICRVGSNCPKREYSLEVQILSPNRGLDDSMKTARQWIDCCCANHSSRCNAIKVSTIPHFFLIHCKTRRIQRQDKADVGQYPPFVALSYVWGKSNHPSTLPAVPRHERSLDEDEYGRVTSIEKTIEDAIKVTLALGYDYLWVDRYCVYQSGHEAIKGLQLQHMHSVFANAEVTLVAAAGNDASAGLPGVSGSQYREIPTARVQGHVLTCIPPDPCSEIERYSTWFTRGWTFQEGLLSRRRLFFSEYEISYECRDMVCREALKLPPVVQAQMTGRIPRCMAPFWMFSSYDLVGLKDDDDGDDLLSILAEYTRRHLTDSDDALNAMMGILQLLAEKEKNPIYHLCGVPVMRVEQLEEFRCQFICHGPPTAESSNRVSIDGFLTGLCWRLSTPGRRRPGFPSWSWTGWTGEVSSKSGFWHGIRRGCGLSVDISIITNEESGKCMEWDFYWNEIAKMGKIGKNLWSGQNYTLSITAGAVTVRVRRQIRKLENGCQEMDWVGIVCVGDFVWQGIMWPTEDYSRHVDKENEYVDTISSQDDDTSLHDKSFPGILLGNSQGIGLCCGPGSWHDTHILLIRPRYRGSHGKEQRPVDDNRVYWERIGLLKIKFCMIDDSQVEQRTWLVC